MKNNNEIDFSQLDSLSNGIQSNTNEPQAQQPIEADTKPYNRLQREQKEREKIRQVYAEYQDNIRKAGQLRGDINKDIAAGADPYSILLKAIELYRSMTEACSKYPLKGGTLATRFCHRPNTFNIS